jgi:urocanate reductase
MNKKILLTTTALLIASSVLVGCKSTPAFNDGTYNGVGEGKNGQLKAEVIVKKGKISEIKIVEHKETPGISDAIIENIPNAIIKSQSPEVDDIAGATITSKAIKDAVADALKTAK